MYIRTTGKVRRESAFGLGPGFCTSFRAGLHRALAALTGPAPDLAAAVEKITGAAAAKIHDLEQQLAALREKEHADCLAVPTDAQRKRLDALLVGADKSVSPPPSKDKP